MRGFYMFVWNPSNRNIMYNVIVQDYVLETESKYKNIIIVV